VFRFPTKSAHSSPLPFFIDIKKLPTGKSTPFATGCSSYELPCEFDLLGKLKLVGNYASHTDPTPYVAVATLLMFVVGLIVLFGGVREWRAKHRLSDWPKNSHGLRRDA
jgi:hypothetical protein